MDVVHSHVIPVKLPDVDTDVIIPAQFLTTTTKTGLGEYLFHRVRNQDENFPTNLPRYQDAKIMVTGSNFGCGSSREHAAWAIQDYGISVIIAPSFADIFYNNAMKNQILPIILPEKIVDQIFKDEQESEHYKIVVDLKKQKVLLPTGESFIFDIDPYRKECLLKGMDDLDFLFSREKEIRTYFDKHPPLYHLEEIKIQREEDHGL